MRLGPKRGGALYTSDDLELLETVADLGGLAIAHAMAYAELEVRRRQQQAASKTERQALIETLAGELSHEMRHPLNYFRHLFGDAGTVPPLQSDEVEVAREEVARMRRLVSELSRAAVRRLNRRWLVVSEVLERAERLLR
ncbi:MAG: sensor histidine kinase, partial [Myxococcota bacterium]